MSSEQSRPSLGLVVCGPCACGKSEVGSALADHYGVPYVDADTFHPALNIQKMSNGVPLTDEDRFPWLHTVRQQMILQKKPSVPRTSPIQVVAACSSLKKIYRDILSGTATQDSGKLISVFVFLNCSEKVLQQRLDSRQGHFMKGNMLSSQLATLELPQGPEMDHAVIVNGDADLNTILAEAVDKIGKLACFR